MDFIKNRRTIRKYKQEDVPADLLNGLLEEAFRAPTMGNMQLYSVIITRDQAMKERLAPAHFHQPMLMEAPVVLTFCADFNRFCKWCRQRKAEPGYDNLLSFMNASIDAIMLTQNFCTLAEAAGLGTCFLGTTIYNPDQIIEALNLPELVIPLATITVGYPRRMPAPAGPPAFGRNRPRRAIPRLFARGHRPHLCLQGVAPGEQAFRGNQPQGDVSASFHRHPLYEGRKRSHVGSAEENAPETRF